MRIFAANFGEIMSLGAKLYFSALGSGDDPFIPNL
jgi:hypothetical protein